jgi:outer membrane protein assembly factor BamD
MASLIWLSGCAATATKENRAELCGEKFKEVKAGFVKKNYWKIKEPIEEILSQCHGTGYMEETQFMLAEANFNLEEWIEARGEYTTFFLNFPSSPYAETAAFRKALASYNMSYTDMRDDSPTQTAVQDFEDFVGNYPSSPLLDSAAKFQDSLTNRLGEKDFQIARLYWRMNEPLASAMYLKSFISDYPTNKRQYEAQLMIIDCYIRLEQFEPAQTYIQNIQQAFPKSKSDVDSRMADLKAAQKKFEARMVEERKQKQYRKEDAL